MCLLLDLKSFSVKTEITYSFKAINKSCDKWTETFLESQRFMCLFFCLLKNERDVFVINT